MQLNHCKYNKFRDTLCQIDTLDNDDDDEKQNNDGDIVSRELVVGQRIVFVCRQLLGCLGETVVYALYVTKLSFFFVSIWRIPYIKASKCTTKCIFSFFMPTKKAQIW